MPAAADLLAYAYAINIKGSPFNPTSSEKSDKSLVIFTKTPYIEFSFLLTLDNNVDCVLFDLLKIIAEKEKVDETYTKEFYVGILRRVNLKGITDLETNYSGVGRTNIKNVLIYSCYPVI